MVETAKEPILVDQQYHHFITDRTAILREAPLQVLYLGAVRFRQACSCFFHKLGGR